MNYTVGLSRLDRALVIFNMLVYRVDAFLSNLIDGLIIASYIVIFNGLLRSQYIPMSVLTNIVLLSIMQHYIYFIVYFINDILDYRGRDKAVKRLNNTFYMLRPIYLYKGSIYVLMYFSALYLLVLVALSLVNATSFEVIWIYAGLFTAISIIHSILRGHYRVVSFALLRLVRYSLIMTLALSQLNIEFDVASTIMVFSLMIIPYVIYSTGVYAKDIHTRNKVVEKIVVFLLSIASISLLICLIHMGYTPSLKHFIATFLSWILVASPAVLARSILRLIFGKENPTVYQHIARVLMGLILIFLFMLLVFIMVNSLLTHVTIS